jgi:hypothetical protein
VEFSDDGGGPAAPGGLPHQARGTGMVAIGGLAVFVIVIVLILAIFRRK